MTWCLESSSGKSLLRHGINTSGFNNCLFIRSCYCWVLARLSVSPIYCLTLIYLPNRADLKTKRYNTCERMHCLSTPIFYHPNYMVKSLSAELMFHTLWSPPYAPSCSAAFLLLCLANCYLFFNIQFKYHHFWEAASGHWSYLDILLALCPLPHNQDVSSSRNVIPCSDCQK